MPPRFLGSDVEITFQHHAARSWIRADAAQIEQAIPNLAVNARDVMPGGGPLTISARNAFALPEVQIPPGAALSPGAFSFCVSGRTA